MKVQAEAAVTPALMVERRQYSQMHLGLHNNPLVTLVHDLQ